MSIEEAEPAVGAILDVVALSPLQRGLYSVSALSTEVDPYLVTFSVRVENLHDVATLRDAFDAVLQRYPHLGGAVVSDGMPHPVLVIPRRSGIPWDDVDLRTAPDPTARAYRLYEGEGRRRLDLEGGPLFRVVAARVTDTAYELICSAHHIVVDGWSIPLLFADVIALHRGEGDALPPAPLLREHAAWLASRDRDVSIREWTAALAELEPMPMVGPPAPADADLAVLGEARLTAEETAAVTLWARSRGLTLNTVLELAWARVLSGLVGRDDVVFGQTTSGRDSTLPGADRMVGALITTIPVRVRVDERSVADIGDAVQRTVARLRAHEYLGIADITRHADAGQLFDTLLVFENTPLGTVTAAMPMGHGATLIPRRIDSLSHYPITVVPLVENGELICRVEIRPDLVDRFGPDRMAQRVLAVVQRLTEAERISDVDVLIDDEPARLTVPGTNADDLPVPVTSVPQVLFDAARRSPDAPATLDGFGEQTFAQFASAVELLASHLLMLGVQPGDAVAVALPRDRRVLHAPFAIALAGGVCVHVDPSTPADRIAYMLETADARVVLADDALGGVVAQIRDLGIDCDHVVPELDGRVSGARADHLPPDSWTLRASVLSPFYVVFTSGTTGRPKGVVTTHAALLSHWSTHERRIFAPTSELLGRQLRVGHGWSTGFDAAWQPTVALLSGHCVVMLDDETRGDAERIVATIHGSGSEDSGSEDSGSEDSGSENSGSDKSGLDIFDTSPSMLHRLIAAGLFTDRNGAETCSLAVLALGGEAISADTWRRLSALPDTRVINFYGPTEATVEALMADVRAHPHPTIGRVFDRMTAEVLDHRLRPIPAGARGELYLSGPQLAAGYLRRPGTTAAAFVAGPHGKRYRTGDLVERSVDGTVVYEGRIDNQVKINGYRVEPGEATVVLRELDGVQHAEAVAYVENGRTRLGALVVSPRAPSDIRAAVSRRLPPFLVPSRIVAVDRIPLNRNGKIDGHRATALLTEASGSGGGSEPATDTERMLLGLITTMSGSAAPQHISITDNLLDLGVDSIGVIDLVSRLRGAGHTVAARDILDAADLRDLARRLDDGAHDTVDHDAATTFEPTAAGTVLPLTPLAREILGNGDYRHLAQSQLVMLPTGVTATEVADVLSALMRAHPTLRSRLSADADELPALVVGDAVLDPSDIVVVSGGDGPALLARNVDRLDPEAGVMVAATVLEGDPGRLLLSVHHLAVDVVSWLILVDDLRAVARGAAALNESPYDGTDLRPTAGAVVAGTPLAGRVTDPSTDTGAALAQYVSELDPADTESLLFACRNSGTSLEDVLLVATALVFADGADSEGNVAVTLESHGRPNDDASRRVGWFTVEETALVPVDRAQEWSPGATTLDLAARSTAVRGQVRLNHLGRFDLLQFGTGPWSPVSLAEFTSEFGSLGNPDVPLRFTVDVTTAVVATAVVAPAVVATGEQGGQAGCRSGDGDGDGPSLVTQFDVNSAVLETDDAAARVRRWTAVLSDLARGRERRVIERDTVASA